MDQVSMQLWDIIQKHGDCFDCDEMQTVEKALDHLMRFEAIKNDSQKERKKAGLIPADRIAEAKDLLQKKDEGLLVELPCPPNSVYWRATSTFPAVSQFEKVEILGDGQILYHDGDQIIHDAEFGDTIFLTAQAAKVKCCFLQAPLGGAD